METKKCTHCGRTVLANSKVCKHCGQSFECEEMVQDETIKTESEQLQTSQSVDFDKNEAAIQQNIDVAQPVGEKRDSKKWGLLAIAGILAVSLSIYWISRTHKEEVSVAIKVEEESEFKNNEDEPEIKENIEFIAPQLSSDKEEENKREENEINFTLSAPEAIVKGANIQLQYTVRGGEPSEEAQIPNKIKGFDILFGPSKSTSSSTQVINGIVTSDYYITYKWTLMAKSEGTFTLPAATIKCNGRIYTSNNVRIKVLPSPKEQNKPVISKEDILPSNANITDIRDLQTSREKAEQEKIYDKVEVMPSFPGGQNELNRFISTNLKYPVLAQESGIEGRVTIRFIVTKTGAISDVTVVRGIDPSCDKEAVRVVKAMPKWSPGKQGGSFVDVSYTIPINFRLTR